MRRADLLGGLAGGRTEHGRIEAGGVVVGLEGLRRLAGGDAQARRAEVRQEARGNPCLPNIGPRADDGNHAARAHARLERAGGVASASAVGVGVGQEGQRVEQPGDILVACARPTA